MNISLTPELEKFVHDKVASGRYHSASEVIREGLRLLEEQGLVREVKLTALREEIQKGLDSGAPTPLDIAAIKARGRKRLTAAGKKNPA
jgi:antitoxin ParD1/3/4